MLLIASAGQNTTDNKARKMVISGADVIRFNFSRRSIEENIQYLQTTQEVIHDLNSSTKTMVDMPMIKNRIGDFDIKFFAVRENEEFICKSATYSPDCNEFIPIDILHQSGPPF